MAKMGTSYVVDNKNPQMNAATTYHALYVENEDGDDEYWLLLTANEMLKVLKSQVKASGWMEELKAGRLYPLHKTLGPERYMLKIYVQGEKKTVFMGKALLETAKKRAASNTEDLPERSWLEDLKD